MTVIEHDQVTVSLEPLRKKNCSLKDGMHGDAGPGGDLDSVIGRESVEFRVSLPPETFDDFSFDRPGKGALEAAHVRADDSGRLLLRQDVDQALQPLRLPLELGKLPFRPA